MSTEQTWQTESISLEDTLRIAEELGSKLRGGEVLQLVSDLGGGKTAFVKGLAKGLSSCDTVTSPSFTISNQYKGQDLQLYHYDFYRLAEPGIMREQLQEAESDPKGVVVLEWAEIVEDVLPVDHVVINIKAISDTGRVIKCTYTPTKAYLFGNS